MRRNGPDSKRLGSVNGRITPQKFWKSIGPAFPGGGILRRLQGRISMSEQDYEQLTLFPGDSPASRSPEPGSAEARRMTVTSGRKCSALCGNSGPVGWLARMLLESSVWRSTRCLLTWKVSATPARRLLFRLQASAPRTEETGALLLPTMTAFEAEGGNLTGKEFTGTRHAMKLTQEVRMWPTPSASDCGRTAINPHLTRNGTIRHIGKNGTQSYARLDAVAAMFPTPKANCWTGPSDPAGRQGSEDLQTMAGGQLNPDWVEWLMGFPIGWTEV